MTRESARERIECELNKLNWAPEIIRSILDKLENEYKAPPNGDLIECAAEACGVNPELVKSKSRKRPAVIARQLVIHELVCQGYTLHKAGGLFDLDHSTAIHAVKTVESMDYYPEMKRSFQKFQLLINN